MEPSISTRIGEHPQFKPVSPLVSKTINHHAANMATAGVQQHVAGLLDLELPVFEEATQTASHFLHIPICIVGIPKGKELIIKAAIGLSQLGLMNPLARTRRLPLDDELANYVLREKRCLVLPRISECELFAQSSLVQEYNIAAYLGVPLITTEGHCIGLLTAMDMEPREFSAEAIAFMELLARWSVSEYERHSLSKKVTKPVTAGETTEAFSLDAVRLTLMSQLTQEMRNPLTTIAGMANMLSREIYGSLTPKQREYAEIVCSSSQILLEMASEVLELSNLGSSLQPLTLTSVDFELLGQHVCKTLISIAKENSQEIRLTVEPGLRQWKLDKDIVRQLLYHLLLTVLRLSGEGGTIRIHGSERNDCLNIAVWVSHPWLGEGLSSNLLGLRQFLSNSEEETKILPTLLAQVNGQTDTSSDPLEDSQANTVSSPRETLSLLLSRHLIERHGGTLTLQGSSESSYRFLVVLPAA